MKSNELVSLIVNIIQSKKGHDITILNLKELSAMADYFIICSADATVHVKAIADEIEKKLRKDGIKTHNREGYNTLNWVLLDYFDVIVHVFRKESREFYNLEKLWGDAEVTNIKNTD